MSTPVLIIDDDARLRDAARFVLESEGYKVIEASDGDAALPMLRSSPAALVLCDMFMPGKDGVETIRALRKEFPELRIIAMSGGGTRSGLDVLRLARHLGAAEILNKPLHRASLLSAVQRVLNAPRAR